jgi:FtsH-binding integral membrane protein
MSLEYFQKRGRIVDEDFSNKQNRRQFLAGALRYMTLSLIGFASGVTVMKRLKLLREGKCTNEYLCEGCEFYEGCRLPQALSKKKAVKEKWDADK